jgi:hypothetical protein
MKPGDENVKVEPCPFCGLSLERHERRGFPIYEHPVVDDDYSCPLVTYKLVVGAPKSDQEIAAWNRRTPPSLAGGVVRPLIWAKLDRWYTLAPVTGREYTLFEEEGKVWVALSDGNLHDFATHDEAKAAAQADYSARILSALTPSPVPTTIPADAPGVHPVERLWREVGLPEYFLGNGGTNDKLYALFDAIRATAPAETSGREGALEEAIEDSIIGGTDDFPGHQPGAAARQPPRPYQRKGTGNDQTN